MSTPASFELAGFARAAFMRLSAYLTLAFDCKSLLVFEPGVVSGGLDPAGIAYREGGSTDGIATGDWFVVSGSRDEDEPSPLEPMLSNKVPESPTEGNSLRGGTPPIGGG